MTLRYGFLRVESQELLIVREMIKTRRYKSAKEFLKDISYDGDMYQNLKDGFVFRGHQLGSYKLVPSVLRHKLYMKDAAGNIVEDDKDAPFDLAGSEFIQKNVEYIELRQFFDICDKSGIRLPQVDRIRHTLFNNHDIVSFFLNGDDWLPNDLQELAALAQHYGMETRLLDWTTSIDIAIYFAVHKEPQLTEEERTDKDSEYVAIWALNIPMVSFGLNSPLRVIRPPYYGNPNLAAQKGLFTFWNVSGFKLPLTAANKEDNEVVFEMFNRMTNRTPLNELIEEECKKQCINEVVMWKLLIPRKDRKMLYEYIRKRNVNAASLFPGYEGAVQCIKEDRSFGL